jgi:hypothetical protein
MNHGLCVINGLGQVMVFESHDDATLAGARMIMEGKREVLDYRVKKVHYVKEGEE